VLNLALERPPSPKKAGDGGEAVEVPLEEAKTGKGKGKGSPSLTH